MLKEALMSACKDALQALHLKISPFLCPLLKLPQTEHILDVFLADTYSIETLASSPLYSRNCWNW